jgi:hypothetical protein
MKESIFLLKFCEENWLPKALWTLALYIYAL